MTRILVLVIFSMVCAILVHSQGPLFSPAPGSSVIVGAGSGRVVLADVNGDGHLDLVTQHLQQRIVTVQLGDGKGRFTAAPNSPIVLGYPPGDIKLGDINNDNILDLGVTSSDRDNVDIFLGNGRGGFSRAPESPFTASASVEFYTRSLHLVDINEDGKLDLVTANGRRNTFATLLGDGRGGFAPAGPRFVTLAEMNGDQRLDIVISHSSDQLSVLLNGGNGSFAPAPASPYDLGTEVFAVVVADVNRDRRNDLVAATVESVTVLLGNNRGFAPAPGSPFPAGPGAYHLSVGDINKDGKLDIAASSFEGNAVTVLLGR